MDTADFALLGYSARVLHTAAGDGDDPVARVAICRQVSVHNDVARPDDADTEPIGLGRRGPLIQLLASLERSYRPGGCRRRRGRSICHPVAP
jgi:hypothetical protein